MHPVEHLIYFTRSVPFFLLPLPHCFFYFINTRAMLGPAAGHTGFGSMGGSYFHYLHHAHLNWNFGTSRVVPIDNVLGTYRAKVVEINSIKGGSSNRRSSLDNTSITTMLGSTDGIAGNLSCTGAGTISSINPSVNQSTAARAEGSLSKGYRRTSIPTLAESAAGDGIAPAPTAVAPADVSFNSITWLLGLPYLVPLFLLSHYIDGPGAYTFL